MKNFTIKHTIAFVLISIMALQVKAQDDESQDTLLQPGKHKGFHAGLFIGAYWANKSTAYLYDGYGFDENGQRNNFNNSILYNQIVNVYGNGNNDLIAQLLNVGHNEWQFTQQNMPTLLRYTTTYMVGLNTRYQLNNRASITLNINATKIAVNGKFTITSMPTNNGFNVGSTQNQFTIVGAEQRLLFQLGYQRIVGKNEKINFVLEGGLNINMAKAQKNQAILNSTLNNGQNNITIDLMSIYKQVPYNYYSAKYLIGVGIGVFAGAGINININPKYTLQLLYTPYFDKINLGDNAKFKMQNGCGLRIYYNLSNL